MIFRDHKLSDEIGFRYSKLGGVEAANDLVRKLHDIHRATQGLEGEFVVPIIMDGENAWEQFARDGKDFFHSLYSQLGQAAWLETVTISGYFDGVAPAAALERLWPGSWIKPDFDTWIGEREENTAWDYLARARAAVERNLAGLPAERRDQVMDEIHIAEGSDWFWWYGLDQGSGNDESFDEAFRGTLARVYALAGEPAPDYLAVPIVATPAVSPAKEIAGPIEPAADGEVGKQAEWERAAYLPHTGGLLGGLAYGYGEEDLWLRLDPLRPPGDLAAIGCRFTVYFSGADDLNARAYAEAPEGAARTYFGFGISSKLEISFTPAPTADLLLSDGAGGWKTGTAVELAAGRVVELAVPFSALGVKTGDDLRFAVEARCEGGQTDVVPPEGFLGLKVPPLGRLVRLAGLEDPRGDDHGPGSYTYPTDPVFIPGAFDITGLEVMLDPEGGLIFRITIDGQVTGPWGGLTGYCLQAVDIYIDTDGVAGSGRRDLYAGRQARTTAANAWEFFVRASMDSVALYDSRAGRLDGVKVTSYADPAAKSILVRVPLEAVGGAGEDWNVIVALLGHDGYAPGGVRPVKADAGQWVFGGCEHEQLCPRIIDLVVEGGASQEQILSSFRAGGLPAEIPGIRMTLR